MKNFTLEKDSISTTVLLYIFNDYFSSQVYQFRQLLLINFKTLLYNYVIDNDNQFFSPIDSNEVINVLRKLYKTNATGMYEIPEDC